MDGGGEAGRTGKYISVIEEIQSITCESLESAVETGTITLIFSIYSLM